MLTYRVLIQVFHFGPQTATMSCLQSMLSAETETQVFIVKQNFFLVHCLNFVII